METTTTKVRKNLTLDRELARRLEELPNQSAAVEEALRAWLDWRDTVIWAVESEFESRSVRQAIVDALNGYTDGNPNLLEKSERVRKALREAEWHDIPEHHGFTPSEWHDLRIAIMGESVLNVFEYARLVWARHLHPDDI